MPGLPLLLYCNIGNETLIHLLPSLLVVFCSSLTDYCASNMQKIKTQTSLIRHSIDPGVKVTLAVAHYVPFRRPSVQKFIIISNHHKAVCLITQRGTPVTVCPLLT